MSLVNPEMLQLCLLFDDVLADFCRHANIPIKYMTPNYNPDNGLCFNFHRVGDKSRITTHLG